MSDLHYVRIECQDCKAKDAEIERLQSRLRDRQNALDHAIDYGHRKDAEIERLRDALERIIEESKDGIHAREIARAALEDD